jgi:hypothetical protein
MKYEIGSNDSIDNDVHEFVGRMTSSLSEADHLQA